MNCSQASATITRWVKGERGQPVANMIMRAEKHARDCGCATCTLSQMRIDHQVAPAELLVV